MGWIDEDFTRFRFGNYTIDYEVAYLSLPPNESAKSNKVSTTTGNWDGRWPIENLEEISNIEGAYGIFTSFKYRIDKTYILAVKK